MNISDVSINRPVFATMMVLSIVVFGIFFYGQLKVDLYPEVDVPVLTISTIYPGADPSTVESQVTDTIEEAVGSVSGIKTMRSVSLESVSQVILEFELGVDLATVTQDTRDRIGGITDLPEDAEEPTVTKLDLGALPILQLALSGDAEPQELARYAEDVLKPELERIRGVGSVELLGLRERQINVEVDLEALRSYSLTVDDLTRALGTQNVDLPGGRLTNSTRELSVRTLGRARDVEALSDLVVATRGASVIRVSDVATVEDGLEERRSIARVDGKEALGVVVQKQSDGNTVEVANAVMAALPKLEEKAPGGTTILILQDNSTQIRGSIAAVEFDLLLGAFLAVFIILVFLRDVRATFISALALPTSVIGTFAFVGAMDFTLNMMTTLALSLSIGILIDDAIVVIENIVRRRTELGESPREAASAGTAEIALAVLAVTLSIVAVFVPVAFMGGMIGQFFYQFGLTVAFAVLLSLFVSFTLTPMLSAILLKEHHGHATGLSGLIERVLDALDGFYRRLVTLALSQRLLTMALAVGAMFATVTLLPRVGFEFVPIQDNAQMTIDIEMPSGTSLDKTAQRASEVAAQIREQPWVNSTFLSVGGGVQNKVNTASILVKMIPKDERTFHLTEAMSWVRKAMADQQGLRASVNAAGGGASSGEAPVQLILQGNDLDELNATAERIIKRLEEKGTYVDLDTNFRTGKPELTVEVDRARAADLGISSIQIASTVRTLMAGTVASELEDSQGRFDIMVQLPPKKREDATALARAHVRTSSGELVELTDVTDIHAASGPGQIERLGRQRQITVSSNLEGLALGDASTEVQKIAGEEAGDGVSFRLGGSAESLQESVTNMLRALLLAIILVYMILAAQFESFLHPVTIMMSLPFSFIGAFGALLLTGTTMSIFGMIGLIMLMGLVTKNAILLVDFVILGQQEEGLGLNEALIRAGATRLRPILMTTAAMIFGMLPVAIGHGEGGEVRAPMGLVVIGGLISSTVLTLLVVPVLYNLMENARLRVMGLFQRSPEPAQEAADPAPH